MKRVPWKFRIIREASDGYGGVQYTDTIEGTVYAANGHNGRSDALQKASERWIGWDTLPSRINYYSMWYSCRWDIQVSVHCHGSQMADGYRKTRAWEPRSKPLVSDGWWTIPYYIRLSVPAIDKMLREKDGKATWVKHPTHTGTGKVETGPLVSFVDRFLKAAPDFKSLRKQAEQWDTEQDTSYNPADFVIRKDVADVYDYLAQKRGIKSCMADKAEVYPGVRRAMEAFYDAEAKAGGLYCLTWKDRARAIVWHCQNMDGDDVQFIDRVYPESSATRKAYEQWAEENGVRYSHYGDDTVSYTVRKASCEYMPYLDTLYFGRRIDDDMVLSSVWEGTDYRFQSQDGSGTVSACVCYGCEEPIYDDRSYTVDDEVYCSDCVYHCDNCNTACIDHQYVEGENEQWCADCACNITDCDSCGIDFGDTNIEDGLCPDCHSHHECGWCGDYYPDLDGDVCDSCNRAIEQRRLVRHETDLTWIKAIEQDPNTTRMDWQHAERFDSIRYLEFGTARNRETELSRYFVFREHDGNNFESMVTSHRERD